MPLSPSPSPSPSPGLTWKKKDVDVLKGFEESQEATIRTTQARLYVQKQRLFLYLRILFGIGAILGSIAIYIYFDIRRITNLYQGLVDITNKTTPSTGVSGTRVAICLTSNFFQKWFAPASGIVNPNFSNALWMMWYTTAIRNRLITVFGGNVIEEQSGMIPVWTAATNSLKYLCSTDTNKSTHELICEVTKTTSTSSLGNICYPPCPLPQSPENTDVGIGAMQSGMGMAGTIGGIAMMGGPVTGLVGGLVGLVAGGILGGMKANAAKKKYEKTCRSIQDSGQCFWPSTYPSCNLG